MITKLSNIRESAPGTLSLQIHTDAEGASGLLIVTVGAHTVNIPVQAPPYSLTTMAALHGQLGHSSATLRILAPNGSVSNPITVQFREPVGKEYCLCPDCAGYHECGQACPNPTKER
jgi:hypothetical protein